MKKAMLSMIGAFALASSLLAQGVSGKIAVYSEGNDKMAKTFDFTGAFGDTVKTAGSDFGLYVEPSQSCYVYIYDEVSATEGEWICWEERCSGKLFAPADEMLAVDRAEKFHIVISAGKIPELKKDASTKEILSKIAEIKKKNASKIAKAATKGAKTGATSRGGSSDSLKVNANKDYNSSGVYVETIRIQP